MTLHAADEAAAAAALRAAGIPHRSGPKGIDVTDPALAWLFFTADNRSPTDRPEHFAHANGACATREVWVALDDTTALNQLLLALGASARDEPRPAPLGVTARVFDLAQGSRVVVVGARHQLTPGRPLIGVVLAGCTATAFAWPPSRTHGLWLAVVPQEP